jgi:hypothetical protein
VKFGVVPGKSNGVAQRIFTVNPEQTLIIAMVPQSATTGLIKVKTRNNGAALSTVEFFVGQEPTILTIGSTALLRGMPAEVTVTGTNLPGKPQDYVVRRSVDGETEPSIQITSATGGGDLCVLTVNISSVTPPMDYYLALAIRGSSTAKFMVISLGSVRDKKLVLPLDHKVTAVRYGKRRSPTTGIMETHLGVLLTNLGVPNTPNSVASSLLLTFVPSLPYPSLEITRRGKDRFTDIQFVDFMGDDNHFIAGIGGKSQDDENIDVDPAFEVFDPANGEPVVARKRIEFKGDFSPQGCASSVNGGCRPDMKTDVTGAFVGSAGLGSKKEFLAIIPQTSFVACCFNNIKAFVYFLDCPPGTSRVRVTEVQVDSIDGNPIERNMVAADLGTGGKKLVIMSKVLVYTFDIATPRLERIRQFSDPMRGSGPITTRGTSPTFRMCGTAALTLTDSQVVAPRKAAATASYASRTSPTASP